MLVQLILNFHQPGKSSSYHIARKFREVKFSQKLIRLSFRDFIFMDSDLINDVNIVSWIKMFAGRDKSAKTTKILPHKTF